MFQKLFYDISLYTKRLINNDIKNRKKQENNYLHLYKYFILLKKYSTLVQHLYSRKNISEIYCFS